MKIALPANGKVISSHFGHCVCFKVFEIENNNVVKQTTIDNVGEHKPGVLPQLLKEHGVNLIIADGIGQKAIELFNNFDIQVIAGVTGLIENAITQFISGTIQGGDNGCSH